MSKNNQRLVVIFVGLIIFALLVTAVRSFLNDDDSNKTPARATDTTEFPTANTLPIPEDHIKPSAKRPITDPLTPEDIQFNFNLEKSPLPKDVNARLAQLGNEAFIALQVGDGREKFPRFWPDDTSGRDANFKTVKILATDVEAKSAESKTARIVIAWVSPDLGENVDVIYSYATGTKINGVWEITDVRQ